MRYASPTDPGLHLVISPENSDCRVTWMWRLNLAAGQSQRLREPAIEMQAALIRGSITVEAGGGRHDLERLDTFYLPGGAEAVVTARAPSVLFIGGAPWEGVGAFFTRSVDMTLPVGPIRQVHGRPPYRRDVFLTLDPDTPASRLICGYTWGDPGGWTSWPPHQHTRDLEEVYAYFDIPAPQFALHLGYTEPGKPEAPVLVRDGDFVAVPEGYHPTVAMPGVRSTYFWVMAAHRRESRRYDLAVDDEHFTGG